MNGSLIRKIGHAVIHAQNGIGHFIFIEHMLRLVHQSVDLCFGKTIYLTEFT
ncbi:hypothetical protein D3C71_1142540 [compost metagenome]